MKNILFKVAFVLTVMTGAFLSKASAFGEAEVAAAPSCVDAENVCYVLIGPDGMVIC